MPVLRDWDLALDADKVLWGQGAHPARIRARRPKLAEIAERVIEEGRRMLEPAVVYERYPVVEVRHERLVLGSSASKGTRAGDLAGPLIAQHLAGAQEVVVAICSVGDRLASYASAQFEADPVRGLALEGMAAAAAEELAEAMCRRIEDLVAGEGLQTSIPLNPGMIGWPLLAGQLQIFALVDSATIGVSLGDTGLMTPLKSVSLVVGMGREMARSGRTCDYCAMRELCRHKDHGRQEP